MTDVEHAELVRTLQIMGAQLRELRAMIEELMAIEASEARVTEELMVIEAIEAREAARAVDAYTEH